MDVTSATDLDSETDREKEDQHVRWPEELPVAKPRSWLRQGFWRLAQLVIGLLTVGAVARLVAHDAVLPLVWINSFTLYFYLPAYPILLLALTASRRWLAIASVGVIVCHGIWVAPDFIPRRSGSAAEASGNPKLRAMSANVISRDSYPLLIDQIHKISPDVLLLQELTHSWRDALETSDLPARYPYWKMLTREGSYGIALLSRYPLADAEIIQVNVVSLIRATVSLEGASLRMYHVHGPSPRFFHSLPAAEAYWAEVARLVAQESGPTAVVGDFNVTQHARWYANLIDQGLHSAHRDCGRGYAVTWPNGTWPIVPPIRIDHALLSAEVECVSIRELPDQLSDHRPLVMELRVLTPSNEAESL